MHRWAAGREQFSDYAIVAPESKNMSEISTLRIYLLRAMYLLMAVGLGITIWPGILAPDNVSHMGSVVRGMAGGTQEQVIEPERQEQPCSADGPPEPRARR